MALYQPTNVTPDLISGPENGVVIVSPGGNAEVSWSINGNSPLLAYKIEFFRNDAASTPGTDTGKITLDEPFYGKDANGNEQRFSVSLPFGVAGTYFTIASMSPNKQGKIRITQWWGATDAQSVVQRSLSVFRTSPDTTADVEDAERQADGSYLLSATVNLPPYAVYGECSVLWARWQIMDADSGEAVEDTGKIWGASDYSYQTKMLLPGTYFALFSFETSFGLTVSQASANFTVSENAITSEGLSAVCDPASGAVLVRANLNKTIPGQYSGVGIGEDFIQINDTDGYASVDFPVVSTEPWGMMWEGSFFDGVSDLADCLVRVTLQNGERVTFCFEQRGAYIMPILSPTGGEELIEIQQFETGARVRVAFVHTGDDEYSWCFAAFEGGGGTYDYTPWYPASFETSPPVKLELFYNSRTYDFTVLFGEAGIDEIFDAMEAGTYITTIPGPALILNPVGFSMAAIYFGGAQTGTVWRGSVGESTLTRIAEISSNESKQWLDYAPGNLGKYYYILTAFSAVGVAVTSRTPEITPCFWDWLLIETEKTDSASAGDYSVLNVFKFGMNFSSGSDGNGAAPNVVSTFTPYPLVMRDTQNRHSGTLAGLIGQMTEPGKYEVTNETRDALRALSRTDHPLFVRTRRGDFFRVAISGEIVTTVQDNALKQPISVSVPWVEIGPVDGSVLEPVPIIPELTPQDVVDASAEMTAEQKAQMKANLWYATESWVTEKINELITVDDTTPRDKGGKSK